MLAVLPGNLGRQCAQKSFQGCNAPLFVCRKYPRLFSFTGALSTISNREGSGSKTTRLFSEYHSM